MLLYILNISICVSVRCLVFHVPEISRILCSPYVPHLSARIRCLDWLQLVSFFGNASIEPVVTLISALCFRSKVRCVDSRSKTALRKSSFVQGCSGQFAARKLDDGQEPVRKISTAVFLWLRSPNEDGEGDEGDESVDGHDGDLEGQSADSELEGDEDSYESWDEKESFGAPLRGREEMR